MVVGMCWCFFVNNAVYVVLNRGEHQKGEIIIRNCQLAQTRDKRQVVGTLL